MCYFILPSQPKTGETKVLSCSTVHNLTEEEQQDPKVKAEMEALDLSIKSRLGTASIEENKEYEGVFIEDPIIYEDISDPDLVNAEPIEEDALMPDVEDFESTDSCYQYISASVMLPKYGGFSRALFMRRKQDSDRNIIGYHHSNPFLDTCIYEFQFHYGYISKYAANLIAENLYSQIDPGGNDFLLLYDILDHKSTNNAVKP